MKGNILHRDLSILNLMYEDRGNGVIIGILNDYDLAIILNDDKSLPPPSSKHRTGTAPFMAYELLSAKGSIAHLYRHDLESFLYVLVWTAMGYEGFKPPKGVDPLEMWRGGDWSAIARDKNSFLTSRVTYSERKVYIVEDHLPVKDMIDGFREIISMAFLRVEMKEFDLANQLLLKYPSLTKDEIKSSDEVHNVLQNILGEDISWEKVSHLFDPESSDLIEVCYYLLWLEALHLYTL